jgi:hypothetical protein
MAVVSKNFAIGPGKVGIAEVGLVFANRKPKKSKFRQ